MMGSFGLSEKRACNLANLGRSTFKYKPKPNSDEMLINRLKQLAQQKRRYGAKRLHHLLRKEGLVKNHKRTERLYRQEGLSIRTKKRKRLVSKLRLVLPKTTGINQIWAADFISDSLYDGRRFRCLCIIDVHSRECLAILADTSITGAIVASKLDQLKEMRAKPGILVVDNGPEFTSRALDRWAQDNKVTLSFIRPGKPIENAYIESFNGRLRDECLNENWFINLNDARQKIENWRFEYNNERPHSSLNNLSPLDFVRLKCSENLCAKL